MSLIARIFHPNQLFRNEPAGGGAPPATDPPADPPATDPPAPTDPPTPPAWTPPTQAEWSDTQRRMREATEAATKTKNEADERQRKEDEEKGNHKAIADRAEQRAKDAEAERDRIKAEREAEQQDNRVERIARQLKFRDPRDVISRIPKADRDDDGKVTAALKAIAKESAYLVKDGETPPTRDVSSGDATPGSGETEPTGVDRMARAYAKTSTTT